MILELSLDEFLKVKGIIFDVRCQKEFKQGRIPSAVNLPLFSDEERAVVGTVYKREGREKAVLEGLKFVGPKLVQFVEMAKSRFEGGFLKLHCWRGGMRSRSLAWLFETVGFETLILKGGYKSFRRWVLKIFEQHFDLKILGGYTGCGKTALLHFLENQGEQVLDLEEVASHKGSSYGNLSSKTQPSQEQFENELATKLFSFDLERPIWVEDESRLIGSCMIPGLFFSQMRSSPLFFIEREKKERVEMLYKDYGSLETKKLKEATVRLEKKLGSERSGKIISHIEKGKIKEAIEEVLSYYDKTYQYGLSLRKSPIYKLNATSLSFQKIAKELSLKKSLRRKNALFTQNPLPSLPNSQGV